MKPTSLPGALLFALLALASCAAPPQPATPEPPAVPAAPARPAWIDRPQAGPADSASAASLEGPQFFAVGVARHRDPALRRRLAADDARSELSKTLRTQAASLVENFMASTYDHRDPSRGSSTQNALSWTGTVASETVLMTVQLESWEDPDDKSLYILLAVPQRAFLDAYAKSMEREVIPGLDPVKRVAAIERVRGQVAGFQAR